MSFKMELIELVMLQCICFLFFGFPMAEVAIGHVHRSIGIKPYKQTSRTVPCPGQCRCSFLSRKLKTDCSKLHLKYIPNNVSRDTAILLLNNNNISANVTHPLNFGLLVKLEHLDLSYNTISRLNSNTFSGLSQLKYLSLASNRLKSAECLSNNVFKPLKLLKALDIHGNCDSYNDRQCKYHDTELGQLPNLESLVMDGALNTNLGPGFRHLNKLRYLKLNSRLQSVTLFTFKNLETSILETLDLDDCHVESVIPHSFAVLKSMKTLILSDNDHLCAEGLKNATTGLNATKIQNLILKRTCNRFQSFKGIGPLYALKDTKLLKLDLESCNIVNVSFNFILLLPKSLLYLSLRDNKFINGDGLLAILYMPNLEYLDGSAQDRYHADKFTNNLGRTLELEPEVPVNMLTDAKNHSRSVVSCHRNGNEKSGAKVSIKSNTHVENRRKRTHITWPLVIPLPPKLKFINASFLRVNSYIPSINFSVKNSLELWDFSNSLLKGACGKIYGLHNLKYLNLSKGALSFVDPFTFGDMKALRAINLSGNPFGKTITQASELLFSNQSYLVYVDLSSASLKQLPWKIFVNNKKLKRLNLAYNFFETITFSVESLTSLELLDLSHNSIKQFFPNVTRQFDQISRYVTIEVNLVSNSLQCTCEYKPFVKWLAYLGKNIMLSNNRTITCMYNNDTEVKVLSLKYLTFDIECVTWVIMTSCVIGFVFLLVIFSSAAYVYTQRWKLRYLYYIGRNNINPYHPLEGTNVNLINDVYISFDETAVLHDGTDLRYFVTSILYLRLREKQYVVKIRDELESGKPLYNTISQTIRTCKKVIVFLDKNYCKEFWNVFEFNMAAYEGIYTSRDVIIPVVVEGTSPKEITGEIKAFVSNRQIMQLKSDTVLNDFIDKVELMIRR